jgi:hypothetical protein
LRLEPAVTDLVRRLLILGADHGFEEGTYAVRAVASTGVTPWRSVAAGLMIHAGRSSKFGHSLAARQFVAETIEAADPEEPIARRMREHEPLPGFESRLYAGGDPRARVLVDYCDAALGDDPAYARFRHALRYAEDVLDRKPAFRCCPPSSRRGSAWRGTRRCADRAPPSRHFSSAARSAGSRTPRNSTSLAKPAGANRCTRGRYPRGMMASRA